MTRGMEGQSKKILSITIALLLGAGIIFFAWKSGTIGGITFLKDTTTKRDPSSLSVLSQPITTKRTLSIWRNSGVARDLSSDNTTDTLAYELITNYAKIQKTGTTTTMTSAQIDAQAQLLAEKAKLPPPPQYQLKNLNISTDNSAAAFAVYGKTINSLILAFIASQTNGDLAIAFAGPSTKSEMVRQKELTENISHYEILKRGLLATKAPSSLGLLQLSLIQTYSNMQNALETMVDIFKDPMRGLGALTQYQNAVENLTVIAGEYQVVMSKIK